MKLLTVQETFKSNSRYYSNPWWEQESEAYYVYTYPENNYIGPLGSDNDNINSFWSGSGISNTNSLDNPFWYNSDG